MTRAVTVHCALLLCCLTLVGCHLYVSEDGEGPRDAFDSCEGPACEPSASPWPDAGPIDDWPDLQDAGADTGPVCFSDLSCGPGCFCNDSGYCQEIDSDPQPDATPFACSDFNSDAAACSTSPSCEPVYSGLHCTATDGSECSNASASCSCESFTFDYCREA